MFITLKMGKEYGSVVEHLCSSYEVLTLTPSTAKKKKGNRKYLLKFDIYSS
jgi:hypothetical protein